MHFTGEERDTETGFVLLPARLYDHPNGNILQASRSTCVSRGPR